MTRVGAQMVSVVAVLLLAGLAIAQPPKERRGPAPKDSEGRPEFGPGQGLPGGEFRPPLHPLMPEQQQILEEARPPRPGEGGPGGPGGPGGGRPGAGPGRRGPGGGPGGGPRGVKPVGDQPARPQRPPLE